MGKQNLKAIEVFYSYAPEDEKLRDLLEKQLSTLKWHGKITDFHHRKITAGTDWKEKVDEYLNTARIILLLISPDFVSSEYCYSFEMNRALEKHDLGEARVIPIILRPVNWQDTRLSNLQVLPASGKPVTLWSNRDAAFLNIANGIQKVVEELSTNLEEVPQPAKKFQTLTNETDLPVLEENDSKYSQGEEVSEHREDFVEKQDIPFNLEESQEFLQYLSDWLQIKFDDLLSLAMRYRESATDAHKYTRYEEQRVVASKLLESNHPLRALETLATISIEDLPTTLRWRFFALRGHCYFQMREFLPAQRDFLFALTTLPHAIPENQYLEALTLRLELAEASRELGQYETSYHEFQNARAMMNTTTSLRYVAESQWGISLILYEQAYKLLNESENGSRQDQEAKEAFLSLMQQSLTYAENACSLYNAINELSHSALMNCQIALIEQAMENLNAARVRLKKILDDWSPTLEGAEQDRSPDITEKVKRYSLKERANIVSAAACYLASVELDAKQCVTALEYIDTALKAGEASYILRRADAYMTRGQILAASNNPETVIAFRQALAELEHTDRLGAKIRVHRMLGAYLIKQGNDREGNGELDKALRLANVPSIYTAVNRDSSL